MILMLWDFLEFKLGSETRALQVWDFNVFFILLLFFWDYNVIISVLSIPFQFMGPRHDKCSEQQEQKDYY